MREDEFVQVVKPRVARVLRSSTLDMASGRQRLKPRVDPRFILLIICLPYFWLFECDHLESEMIDLKRGDGR